MSGKKNGTGQELGKWFETKVKEALDNLQTKQKATYQRLYDTTSAAGFMPSMPGDFIAVWHGLSFLLEVKASTRYLSLQDGGAMRSLIKSHQSASQRVWHRAGASGAFMFLAKDLCTVEIWEGNSLALCHATPRGKLTGKPVVTCHISQLEVGMVKYFRECWSYHGSIAAEKIKQEEEKCA